MESDERAAVRRGMDGLKPFLAAFVAQRTPVTQRAAESDTAALLKTILDHWETRFRAELPSVAKSYVHELRDVRNRWAHEAPFTPAETARALDTIAQLAYLIGAPAPEAKPRLEPSTGGTPLTRPTVSPPTKSPRKWSGQREVMREIYAAWRADPERVIFEYAKAEREGRVQRKANKSGLSAEEYARALLADGEKKGWLK